jgi:hypothetical protein
MGRSYEKRRKLLKRNIKKAASFVDGAKNELVALDKKEYYRRRNQFAMKLAKRFLSENDCSDKNDDKKKNDEKDKASDLLDHIMANYDRGSTCFAEIYGNDDDHDDNECCNAEKGGCVRNEDPSRYGSVECYYRCLFNHEVKYCETCFNGIEFEYMKADDNFMTLLKTHIDFMRDFL